MQSSADKLLERWRVSVFYFRKKKSATIEHLRCLFLPVNPQIDTLLGQSVRWITLNCVATLDLRRLIVNK